MKPVHKVRSTLSTAFLGILIVVTSCDKSGSPKKTIGQYATEPIVIDTDPPDSKDPGHDHVMHIRIVLSLRNILTEQLITASDRKQPDYDRLVTSYAEFYMHVGGVTPDQAKLIVAGEQTTLARLKSVYQKKAEIPPDLIMWAKAFSTMEDIDHRLQYIDTVPSVVSAFGYQANLSAAAVKAAETIQKTVIVVTPEEIAREQHSRETAGMLPISRLDLELSIKQDHAFKIVDRKIASDLQNGKIQFIDKNLAQAVGTYIAENEGK